MNSLQQSSSQGNRIDAARLSGDVPGPRSADMALDRAAFKPQYRTLVQHLHAWSDVVAPYTVKTISHRLFAIDAAVELEIENISA